MSTDATLAATPAEGASAAPVFDPEKAQQFVGNVVADCAATVSGVGVSWGEHDPYMF